MYYYGQMLYHVALAQINLRENILGFHLTTGFWKFFMIPSLHFPQGPCSSASNFPSHGSKTTRPELPPGIGLQDTTVKSHPKFPAHLQQESLELCTESLLAQIPMNYPENSRHPAFLLRVCQADLRGRTYRGWFKHATRRSLEPR